MDEMTDLCSDLSGSFQISINICVEVCLELIGDTAHSTIDRNSHLLCVVSELSYFFFNMKDRYYRSSSLKKSCKKSRK